MPGGVYGVRWHRATPLYRGGSGRPGLGCSTSLWVSPALSRPGTTLFSLLSALSSGQWRRGTKSCSSPPNWAPRSAELIGTVIAELYPPEYITVVLGDSGVAAEFSVLPFDHLLFTGSGRVGKLVMRAASENLTPVTLELGGKSPALIHPTYPLRRATERILNGKLYNAGQTTSRPTTSCCPMTARMNSSAWRRRRSRRFIPASSTIPTTREF